MLAQGRPVPLSSQRIINADEFGQALERLRINVPSSIRESERMLAERDAILAEAQAQAQSILDQAGQKAREMLTDNALVVAAQREAERILDESRVVGQQRIDEADYYAGSVLQDLAAKLVIISQQVDNGVRMLQNNPSSTTEEPGDQPE
jgi:cell division septum initiation protein DivIVA